MSIKHDVIDVRVSQQILWIGSDAYPLKGITRVGSRTWVPRRGVLVWEFLKSVVGWWFAGFLIAVVLFYVQNLPILFMGLVAGLVTLTVVKAVRLSSWLRFTFHKLDVETASSSTTALVSKDPGVVRDLVVRITAAINNPAAEFHVKVDSFHLGDNITQHGDNSQVVR